MDDPYPRTDATNRASIAPPTNRIQSNSVETLTFSVPTFHPQAAKAAMATQPDNIMMLMMMVMPVATQVCQPVLQKFGFSADQGGLMVEAAWTHAWARRPGASLNRRGSPRGTVRPTTSWFPPGDTCDLSVIEKPN